MPWIGEFRDGLVNRLTGCGFFKPKLNHKQPAKEPQPPHNRPRFIHIFTLKKSRFWLQTPEETAQQTGTTPE